MKRAKDKKIRVTLDLSEAFYDRLNRLESLVDAETKASLIRQALQLYEYVAQRYANGWTFRAVNPTDGSEETVVFFSANPGTEQREKR